MKARRRTAVLLGVVLVLLGANIAVAHDWWFWHQHKRTLGINITAVNAESAGTPGGDLGPELKFLYFPPRPHPNRVGVPARAIGENGGGGGAGGVRQLH